MSADETFLFQKKNRLPLFFMVLTFVLICSAAWIGDDAFIGLRSIKHFLQGDGWRYNVSERVQTFTNPLLMICATIAVFITKEYYFTLMFLNLAASAIALYLFYFRQEKSVNQLVFCSLLLILSAAFKDYATSGLENSFGYPLAALFFLRFFSKRTFNDRDVFFLSFMTGLMLLTRTDTLLIVFPALTYACLRRYEGNKKRLLFLVPAGLSPFILWEVFSVVYYGFPFPNTYYTKLKTGIPTGEYLIRGWWYYEYSFLFDTVTLFGIAAGLSAMFYKPADFRFTATGIGVVLYLLYIVYIGGDFMGGRFLALPFFVCVFVFSYGGISVNFKKAVPLFAVCLIIPFCTLRSFQAPARCLLPWNTDQSCFLKRKNVANEKAFWKLLTFFIYQNGTDVFQKNPELKKLFVTIPHVSSFRTPVRFRDSAGVIPYLEDDVHIVDLFGLTDPLLPRFPAVYEKDWKSGHILRVLPKGYKETLETGKNLIADKEQAEYYDKLKEVVSGPVFSLKRFKSILDINLKPLAFEQKGIRISDITEEERNRIYQGLNERNKAETMLKMSRKYDISSFEKYDIFVNLELPFTIDLGKERHASELTLETTLIDPNCSAVEITFINSRKNVLSVFRRPYSEKINVAVPDNVKETGFDKIMIVRTGGDNPEIRGLPTDVFLVRKVELTD